MKYILALLVFLVIADGLVTNFLVTNGLAREGNPFLRGLVGGGSFIAVKTAGAFVAALILWDVYRHSPRLGRVSGVCFTIVYAGIVTWNLYQVF
ncbi:MAG: hypothetical protein HYX79_01980 [Chloroflexi bacterium]|nr:hypothetical protein [Chloroflexota bacterium]